MKFTPHPYQSRAVRHLIDKPRAALFLDMGLGKTVSTLTAASLLTFDGGRVLVIAPKKVAEETWTGEVDKWDHLTGLRVSKILGDEKKRRAALNATADIYVTNVDSVVWLVKVLAEAKRVPFDLIVVDESSLFKDRGSNRWKALAKIAHKVPRFVLLTATPCAEGYLGLWSQMALLDRGERLGKSLTAYREEFFVPDRRSRERVYSYKLRSEEARAEIERRISDLCLTMRAEDYITMPPRIDVEVRVKLPAGALRQYQRLERDSLLEYAEGDVVAPNAAALANKLLQAANGHVYDEHGRAVVLHDAKLDALAEILEVADSPVFVGYTYTADLDRMRAKFPGLVEIHEPDAVKRFNAGEIKVLAAHPKSAGHGLNLQELAAVVVWFGLPWSLELYSQFVGRVHRQGQRRPVIVHHLLAEGTADAGVLDLLRGKWDSLDQFLNAMKGGANA